MGQTVGGVGVIDKSLCILDSLESGPQSLAELVSATGISRATAHRLAVALEAHGLVRRDTGGRFALGARLISLGRAAAHDLALAGLARAPLEELRDRTGESVQLYVRDGDARVCVAALESPHGLRTIVPLGAVLPLGLGSAGRILAATGVVDQASGSVVATGAEARTAARAAATGEVDTSPWVASVGEREPGVASVSAPVRDASGNVLAAVSVSGPVERTSTQPGRQYGSAVVQAAMRIEAAIGGEPGVGVQR